jgi:hypothetical protein
MTRMINRFGEEHLIEHPRRVAELKARGWIVVDDDARERIRETFDLLQVARARAREAVPS